MFFMVPHLFRIELCSGTWRRCGLPVCGGGGGDVEKGCTQSAPKDLIYVHAHQSAGSVWLEEKNAFLYEPAYFHITLLLHIKLWLFFISSLPRDTTTEWKICPHIGVGTENAVVCMPGQ